MKIGDRVRCGMCDACGYQNGEIVEVWENTVEVNWSDGFGDNIWAKTDLVLISQALPPEAGEQGCSHIFIPYQGIRECFDYCCKCDTKRDQ